MPAPLYAQEGVWWVDTSIVPIADKIHTGACKAVVSSAISEPCRGSDGSIAVCSVNIGQARAIVKHTHICTAIPHQELQESPAQLVVNIAQQHGELGEHEPGLHT